MEQKANIEQVLDNFPSYKLQNALLFGRYTLLQKEKETTMLLFVPITSYIDAGMNREQISDAIEVLVAVHQKTAKKSANRGIRNISSTPPKINNSEGKELFSITPDFPLSEMIEVIGKREGSHYGGKKIALCYSKKYGIYTCNSQERPCPLTPQEFETLKYIHNAQGRTTLSDIAKATNSYDDQNTSRNKREINRKFKEKLRLEKDIIVHNSSAGFFINEAVYTLFLH